MKLSNYDTPALVVDFEAAKRNIESMTSYFRGKKASLRAHTKVHKSPYLAHLQLSAGSKGITSAKLGEGELIIIHTG